MRLEGKVAIVTGATKGIGRVIASTIAAEGAKVVLAGRTVQRGEAMVEGIKAAGGDAVFVPTDVGREDDVVKVVQTAVERFGQLTTLVNNAASTDLVNRDDAMVTEVSVDAWDKVLRVTLTGAMLMSKHSIPRMIESGGGAIVNISSEGSYRPDPEMAAYAAAKAGMNSLTRSIAVAFGRQNVRANTIITGMILPPQSLPLFEADPAAWQKLHTQHLTTRLGRREDIAAGVVYLASDESGFVTGAELPIEGGSRIMSNLLPSADIFGAGG
jgi:NAD(P)-dependent dehydrogenase (short-subunit alcohol dehydrogenase family)